MTWFDKITAKYRHLLIVLGVSLLGAAALWLQASTDTILDDIPDVFDPFVAGLIGYAILWVTKITRQYGVGSEEEPEKNEDPAPAEDAEVVADGSTEPVDGTDFGAEVSVEGDETEAFTDGSDG